MRGRPRRFESEERLTQFRSGTSNLSPELSDHWQIGLGGEFDLLLLGLQFSQVFNDGVVTNMQWPGVGARGSLELRHRSRSLDLSIAPFAQYWWVDDSTASHGWYEPRNQSFQYGLSLIWRF